MKLLLLILLVSCGKQDPKNACQSREQVLIQCVADGIKVRPEPWQVDFIRIDCNREYAVDTCYDKRTNYFPFED